jgi:hypothetical protein
VRRIKGASGERRWIPREEQRKLMQRLGKGTKSERAKALKKRQGGAAIGRKREGWQS